MALVVSGGHTFLVEMRGPPALPAARPDRRRRRGRGLRQGRPAARAAVSGRPGDHEGGRRRASTHDRAFPRAWLGDTFDFSFSGLKTAARREVARELGIDAATMAESDGHGSCPKPSVAELAYGFQDSVVDVLATKTMRAAEEIGARTIIVGGGVAANCVLRERIADGRGVARHPRGRAAAGPVHRQRVDDRRGRLLPRPRRCARRRRPGREAVAQARRAGAGCDDRSRRRSSIRAGCSAGAGRALPAPARPGGAQEPQPEPPRRRRRCSRPSSTLAEPAPGRHVLEIGPGLGILTGALLERGAQCDGRRGRPPAGRPPARALRGSGSSGSCDLVEADVLDIAGR